MLAHDHRFTRCIEAVPDEPALYLRNCDKTNLFQKWEWSVVNDTMLDNWESMGAKVITY
jgi:hypothetical protein